MKEIQTIKKQGIEVSVKQQKQIERQFIGKMLPFQGHRVWEINSDTLEVKEAQFIKQTIAWFNGNPKKEIMINKGCVYISALNKQNAVKKYFNRTNGSRL